MLHGLRRNEIIVGERAILRAALDDIAGLYEEWGVAEVIDGKPAHASLMDDCLAGRKGILQSNDGLVLQRVGTVDQEHAQIATRERSRQLVVARWHHGTARGLQIVRSASLFGGSVG